MIGLQFPRLARCQECFFANNQASCFSILWSLFGGFFKENFSGGSQCNPCQCQWHQQLWSSAFPRRPIWWRWSDLIWILSDLIWSDLIWYSGVYLIWGREKGDGRSDVNWTIKSEPPVISDPPRSSRSTKMGGLGGFRKPRKVWGIMTMIEEDLQISIWNKS